MKPADSDAATILLLGNGPLAKAIADRLRRGGSKVAETASLDPAAVASALAGIASLESLVILAPEPRLGTPMLEVTDRQLEASLAEFLDLFGALSLALPRLADGGGLVAVSTRGHLGAWGGAHEMAFSGAVAGLLRSVALENMDRGVRANVIAIDPPAAGGGADPTQIADLTQYLLSSESAAVNGELILANGGRSLKMREARDRRGARKSIAAQ